MTGCKWCPHFALEIVLSGFWENIKSPPRFYKFITHKGQKNNNSFTFFCVKISPPDPWWSHSLSYFKPKLKKKDNIFMKCIYNATKIIVAKATKKDSCYVWNLCIPPVVSGQPCTLNPWQDFTGYIVMDFKRISEIACWLQSSAIINHINQKFKCMQKYKNTIYGRIHILRQLCHYLLN